MLSADLFARHYAAVTRSGYKGCKKYQNILDSFEKEENLLQNLRR